MILTCPQCATRYQIEDRKFPPEGRKVRCTKCGHLWFQAAPPPEPEPASVSAPPPFPSARNPQGHAEAAPAGAENVRVRTPQRSRGEGIATLAGWFGLAAVLALIVWGMIRYRDTIVAVWPQTAPVYAALHLPANAHGLAFETVSYRRGMEAGQPVLIVNGTLVNAGPRAMAVPQIEIVLTDNARHSVARWTFSPPKQRIEPGARMTFITRRANPPASARHLDIRFAGTAA